MSDFLSLSNAVTLASIVVAFTSIVYGAIQGFKAIVELRRGRSTGWLKVIFVIFDVPESQWERNIFPHPSGLVIIENRGPFEEYVAALHYSIEGKALLQVQWYRQMFRRSIDKMMDPSYEQQRFDRAIEASAIHSKAKAYAFLDVSPTASDEWQRKNDAIRKEINDALESLREQREDDIVIEYPLSIPAGSTRQVHFEIPEQWEHDLNAITCLTVQTTKEILHVKRAYPEASLPCTKCRTKHHKNQSHSL